MVITLQNVGLGVYPVKIQWFKYFYSTDLCNPNGRPELFPVGVELVFRALFDQSAVLDLAVGGNRKQIALEDMDGIEWKNEDRTADDAGKSSRNS